VRDPAQHGRAGSDLAPRGDLRAGGLRVARAIARPRPATLRRTCASAPSSPCAARPRPERRASSPTPIRACASRLRARSTTCPRRRAELPALAQLAARRDLGDGPLARRALHASFRLGGDERARLLADVAARTEGDPRLRREALDLLARWEKPPGRDAFTGAWRPLEPRDPTVVRALVPALRERGITDAPDEVRAAWIALVGRYKVDECTPTVLAWASDATLTPKLRAAALAALGEIATTEAVDALRGAVLDPDGEVRAAALAAIQKAAPGEALPILKNALASADPRELRAVYQGLAKVSDPEPRPCCSPRRSGSPPTSCRKRSRSTSCSRAKRRRASASTPCSPPGPRRAPPTRTSRRSSTACGAATRRPARSSSARRPS
jgi:hypothetical protein